MTFFFGDPMMSSVLVGDSQIETCRPKKGGIGSSLMPCRSASPIEPRFPIPFSDDTRFVQQALSEYLQKNKLRHILFRELDPGAQSQIMQRAQELKAGMVIRP